MTFLSRFVVMALCALISSSTAPSFSHAFSQEVSPEAVEKLAVGEYFRPTRDVSGEPGTSASFKRSPCPALNALANHGYLPRRGEGLSIASLSGAVTEYFGISNGFAKQLVAATKFAVGSFLGFEFSLADISKHNRIEHDVSLVHNDAYMSSDPHYINITLVEDLLAYAEDDGVIDVQEMGLFRRAREAQSIRSNPELTFGAFQQFLAHAEAAFVLNVLGRDEKISLEYARAFLAEERIPEDYRKPQPDVSLEYIQPTMGKVAAMRDESVKADVSTSFSVMLNTLNQLSAQDPNSLELLNSP